MELDKSVAESPEINEEYSDEPFSERLERCYSAMRGVKTDEPIDFQNIGFDFRSVFKAWYFRCPAWLDGCMPYYEVPGTAWEDVYRKVEKGPPILAFISKEGVLVAVDDLVTGTGCVLASELVERNLIRFNSHVIGFVTGEVTDFEIENFLKNLKKEGREGSAAEVSDWLVHTLPPDILKGLSGILIAGWDETGPSLYRLYAERGLHRGVLFACGYCSDFGYGVVGNMSFPFLPLSEAVKVARFAIPTAIAEAEFYGRSDYHGAKDIESGRIGESVKVFCGGPNGFWPVDDEEEDIKEPGTEKPENKRRKISTSTP